jgi:phosphatidylserine/phosphatidylglycerophosphate/cardiolipin synthase-like enzyme
MAFLEPERTCWRLARAGRVAFLVDTQAYFSAIRLALQRARRSVLLLGWSFDPRTRLQPDGIDAETGGIGRLLIELSDARPELDIRLLAWKSALPIAISQDFFPHRAQGWFLGTRVQFRLDAAVPMGACHHQKVLVIDDRLAFCGGGDISIDRWDTTAHLDADSRRLDPDHHFHAPRHEVVMMVDGEAAAALGDLARERWRRATDEALAPPPAVEDDPWPPQMAPDLVGAQVAIVRTEPAWGGRSGVDEWRELTLRAIAGARRVIYMENQYFTSPVVAAALARRLAEPDGPEIVLVSTQHSPSYFDKATMDQARAVMLRWLHEADVYGRFRAYHPSTRHGAPVLVHAKVMVVDDRLARIGSANLNNRSGGVDTECELAIEASGPADRGGDRLPTELPGGALSRPQRRGHGRRDRAARKPDRGAGDAQSRRPPAAHRAAEARPAGADHRQLAPGRRPGGGRHVAALAAPAQARRGGPGDHGGGGGRSLSVGCADSSAIGDRCESGAWFETAADAASSP